MFDDQRGEVLPELEQNADFAGDIEITDLDPPRGWKRPARQWRIGQLLIRRRRLWLTLGTLLGVAVLCFLLVSSLRPVGASQGVSTAGGPASLVVLKPSTHHAQVLVAGRFVYSLYSEGIMKATWSRHRITYLLWQRNVAPESQLLRGDQNMVLIATPSGDIIALRSYDGAILSIISYRDQQGVSGQSNGQAPGQGGAAWRQKGSGSFSR